MKGEDRGTPKFTLSHLPLVDAPKGARMTPYQRHAGPLPNQHGPTCCCSRMPLIGLVRLQRALGGVTPPFDPITAYRLPSCPVFDNRIRNIPTREVGRRGHGARPAPGGNRGTGACCLPDGKDGIQSVPRAARDGRTCAAQVGDTHDGKLS